MKLLTNNIASLAVISLTAFISGSLVAACGLPEWFSLLVAGLLVYTFVLTRKR